MIFLDSCRRALGKGLARFTGFFFVGLCLILLSTGIQATLVPVSGQQILNTASADFPNNPNPGPVVSNPTDFTLGSQEPTDLEILKTADKSAAEPGDVVVYRLVVNNPSNRTATDLTVVDNLPRGLSYIEDSVNTAPTPPNLVSFTAQNRQLSFRFDSLAPGTSVQILYAVLLTPDSVRGSGVNVATASAPGFPTVQDDFRLAIRAGILSDCGTIIGRIFVDKNFDGEQQPGEPGVPNAVVYLDNGNRILADPDGLFSMANVLSGNRVGVLDLSSLPGYTLAPNLYRLENNSQSRLVRLEPGGLARMNFAVTPTYGEGQN